MVFLTKKKLRRWIQKLQRMEKDKEFSWQVKEKVKEEEK